MSLQNLPLDKIKQIQEYFSKNSEVKTVFLFGSYARGDASQQSDIDLAVIFNGKGKKGLFNSLGGFIEDLSSVLNTKVDVQDIDQADSMFKFRVLSEGKILCDMRKEGEKFDYQTHAVDEYFELKPVYNEILREMSNRIKNNSFAQTNI